MEEEENRIGQGERRHLLGSRRRNRQQAPTTGERGISSSIIRIDEKVNPVCIKIQHGTLLYKPHDISQSMSTSLIKQTDVCFAMLWKANKQFLHQTSSIILSTRHHLVPATPNKFYRLKSSPKIKKNPKKHLHASQFRKSTRIPCCLFVTGTTTLRSLWSDEEDSELTKLKFIFQFTSRDFPLVLNPKTLYCWKFPQDHWRS